MASVARVYRDPYNGSSINPETLDISASVNSIGRFRHAVSHASAQCADLTGVLDQAKNDLAFAENAFEASLSRFRRTQTAVELARQVVRVAYRNFISDHGPSSHLDTLTRQLPDPLIPLDFSKLPTPVPTAITEVAEVEELPSPPAMEDWIAADSPALCKSELIRAAEEYEVTRVRIDALRDRIWKIKSDTALCASKTDRVNAATATLATYGQTYRAAHAAVAAETARLTRPSLGLADAPCSQRIPEAPAAHDAIAPAAAGPTTPPQGRTDPPRPIRPWHKRIALLIAAFVAWLILRRPFRAADAT